MDKDICWLAEFFYNSIKRLSDDYLCNGSEAIFYKLDAYMDLMFRVADRINERAFDIWVNSAFGEWYTAKMKFYPLYIIIAMWIILGGDTSL